MLLDTDRTEIDIFVGTRIGSFKHIKYHTEQSQNSKKCIENLQEISTLQKEDTVTSLAWASDDQEQVLLGRASGVVQTYDTITGAFVERVVADHGKGRVVGACRVKRKLVTALSDGTVRVWGKRPTEFRAGGQLDVMKCCAEEPGLIITGGKDNDLKMWRLSTQEPVFSAKNVRNDWLELRAPVWATDVCFLPGGSCSVASCSRHGTVRLYDTRAQRRPVCEVAFPNMAATCIAPGLGERQVLVGFSRGQLHNVDLRGKGNPDKGYKGSVGAVTAAQLVPGAPYVVSISLDRHMKVHHAESKKLLYMQYLTSQLTCLLVQTERSTPLTRVKAEVKHETEEITDDAVTENVGDDLDELFDDMETVVEKPKKRKKADKKTAKKKLRSDSDVEVIKTDEELVQQARSQDARAEVNEDEDVEDGIATLLRLTEKKKRKMEIRKKKKKARSVFHNA